MVSAIKGIKVQQTAKLVQRALGTLLLRESARLFHHPFISITLVDLSNDCSLAKVYVSVWLSKDPTGLLKKMNSHTSTIRKLLGKQLAGKMHKVPKVQFIADNSVIQGARVTALIDQLTPDER